MSAETPEPTAAAGTETTPAPAISTPAVTTSSESNAAEEPTPSTTTTTTTPATPAAAAPTTPTTPSPEPKETPTKMTEETTPELPERPPMPEPEAGPTVNSAPTVTTDHLNEDPHVASLHAMFPDFDGAVLQSVLESVGGDQDRAIDMLLGMSDPEYVSQAAPAPVQSQTDLDEEFARRLAFEEDSRHQHEQSQQSSWQPSGGYDSSAPYQTRDRRGGRQQQQQPGIDGAEQKDSMAEFQDQFNKIADTGKKTFSSLFTKVKAKMQEFDQQRTGQTSTPPSWGEQPQQQGQPSYYEPSPSAQRHESTAPAPAPAPAPVAAPVQGYDATPAPRLIPNPSSPEPASGTPPPPSTSSGAPPIDASKLGMLPKRPVSLLNTEPAPKKDDDDELEYAENPFEEHK